jgi:mono/diheme cytochrome c family protein
MGRGLLMLGFVTLLLGCGGANAPAPAPVGNVPVGNAPGAPASKDGVERKPVPAEFAAKQPPRPLTDPALIALGKELYHDAARANCTLCHGDTGKGDGFLAKSYEDPAVPDITGAAMHDSVTDQYIYWRLAKPFESKVKDFSSMNGYPTGTEEELWALVAYVRSLRGE